ncbi:MAG: GNAT family N-acetyltransferase [Actinomycetota bacterium]|nr:GNAT family N-acetyltransferase [Actinomycetota bacterium]
MTPQLAVRPLTIEDGMDIAMWRYPGPWAVYDALEAPRPDEGYWAVCDADDRLVGFCCLGDCARPVGLETDPAFLDVAIGVRPELTGHGLGSEVGRVAVSYARQVSDGRRLRCAVRDWNHAGLEAAHHAGFAEAGSHTIEGQRYVVLEMTGRPGPAGEDPG